jgi:hypothetical protein
MTAMPTATHKSAALVILAFMAIATACMLAFALHQAARGLDGLPGLVLYSFCAGFGLEFVSSAWRGRWREERRANELLR